MIKELKLVAVQSGYLSVQGGYMDMGRCREAFASKNAANE